MELPGKLLPQACHIFYNAGERCAVGPDEGHRITNNSLQPPVTHVSMHPLHHNSLQWVYAGAHTQMTRSSLVHSPRNEAASTSCSCDKETPRQQNANCQPLTSLTRRGHYCCPSNTCTSCAAGACMMQWPTAGHVCIGKTAVRIMGEVGLLILRSETSSPMMLKASRRQVSRMLCVESGQHGKALPGSAGWGSKCQAEALQVAAQLVS